MERRLRTVLWIGAIVVLALVVAGCGGSSEGTPSQEELDEIAKEINEEVPNVGLGEGGPPPPDAADWKTDFTRALVPLDEFHSGGPPKDGIPAIDEPTFVDASKVDWLEKKEPVIQVTIGGETRGYPIQILMWHEIVNDRIGGTPIAVTFCPLCNTAIVFDRRLDGDVLDFGTTGKLRDSDLVMYDRQTESWWQQFAGEALVGKHAGKKLTQVPARIVSWDEFRGDHASSLVLDRNTGFARNYGLNPYVGYDDVDTPPFFPVEGDDDRLPPKARVAYVEVGEKAFAVPFTLLAEKGTVELDTDEGTLVVAWREGVASALDGGIIASSRDVGAVTVELDGEPVPFMEPFWFAVAAFRPDIEIVRD